MTQPQLRLAGSENLAEVLPFVRAYHAFENVVRTDAERLATLQPLLADRALGRIWLIDVDSQPVGYIALCFGYGIEFMGKDAFIDEFFIEESWRRQGIGSAVLATICKEAARLGVRGLHLEVARDNLQAKALYAKHGFDSRERFHLMSQLLPKE